MRAQWIPPETKRRLDERYKGSMKRACLEHGLAYQSIKDLYTKSPPGVQNIVGVLTALGFDDSNEAMKVLKEMAGQNGQSERTICSSSNQNSGNLVNILRFGSRINLRKQGISESDLRIA